MAKKPDPFMVDADNPPLDAKFWKRARPAREVLSASFIEDMAAIGEERRKKLGRPAAKAPKVPISLRLGSDVVNGLRASGAGYNGRVDKLLRAALAKGRL